MEMRGGVLLRPEADDRRKRLTGARAAASVNAVLNKNGTHERERR